MRDYQIFIFCVGILAMVSAFVLCLSMQMERQYKEDLDLICEHPLDALSLISMQNGFKKRRRNMGLLVASVTGVGQKDDVVLVGPNLFS